MKAFLAGLVALLTVSLPAGGALYRPKIYGISFVRFKSTSLEKSAAFYSKILGLHSHANGCKNVSAPCFVVNVSEHIEITQATADASASFLDEVGFSTASVTLMRDYLVAQGISATEVTRGENGLQFFECQDPEGHRIAFVDPPPAPDASYITPSQVGVRLLHAGFVVKDLSAENRFYLDLLGFRPYWYGGFKDQDIDWYEIQVRQGDSWIEYMLNIPANADHQELGVQNHFSLGVKDAQVAAAQLRKNGLQTFDGPEIGRDGKNSLDAYDPDGTRVEIMEFTPSKPPCCHPYTAPHPKP